MSPLGIDPSRQELAVRAMVERLKTAAAALGSDAPEIHRSRVRPINQEELKERSGAVVVYALEEDRDETLHDGSGEDVCKVRTELRVLAPDGETDRHLDPLFVWVVTTLMQDTTLGGVVEDLGRTRRQWAAVEFDHPYGGMAIDWTVTLYTMDFDPREKN